MIKFQCDRLRIGLKTNIETVMNKKILTTIGVTIVLALIAMAAFVYTYKSSEVAKAFSDFEIVPDILNAAPKEFVNVSFLNLFYKIRFNSERKISGF